MQHLVDDEKLKCKGYNFEKGKYSCGYSAISEVLNNYGYNVSECDLFFLANGFCFEMLNESFCIGYNSLKDTYYNLEKNINLKVSYHDQVDTDEMYTIICNELKKGNLPILYVQSKSLYYHDIKKVLYPYHMVIVTEIDKTFIEINDVYMINDYGKISTFSGKLKCSELLPSVNELMIINNEKCQELKKKEMKSIIADNFLYFLNDSTHGLSQLKTFYQKLYKEIDDKGMEKLSDFPELMEVFKWLILLPLFNYIKLICSQFTCDSENQNLDKLYGKWIVNTGKLIKYYYGGKKDRLLDMINESGLLLQEFNEVILKIMPNFSTTSTK